MMKPKIRQAVMRTLAVQIDQSNYGMLSSARPNWDDFNTLNRAGIVISSKRDEVLHGEVVIARIRRNYAAHKRNGMYKQLKPTLVMV